MTKRRNLITDVPGLSVGNAEDHICLTGVTVVLLDQPAVAAVDIRGGGPGTRDTDALGLSGSVDVVHGIALSGGSAFGLSAATAVQSWLAAHGRGLEVAGCRVPIVPQAILFDLANGGDKAWGETPPYERLAREACHAASRDFAIGSAGAGYGATTATLRGGLGSASFELGNGVVTAALVAVNAVGSISIGHSAHFWAAPFEKDGEFGGLGMPSPLPSDALTVALKGGPQQSTTLALVATNARLDKRQCHRLAVMAQTGLARAIYPVHTPLDGDTVFALATGDVEIEPIQGLAMLGAETANCLARAVGRGVYEAAPAPDGYRGPPAWRTRFSHSRR